MRTVGSILVGLGIACFAISLSMVILLAIGTRGGGMADAYGAGMAIGMVILGIPGGLVLWWTGLILKRRPRGGYTVRDGRRGLIRLAGGALVCVGLFFFIGGLSAGVGRGPDPEGESALATAMGVLLSIVFLVLCLGIVAAGVLLRRRFEPSESRENVAQDSGAGGERRDQREHGAEDRLVVQRCPACRILNRIPGTHEGETFECSYCGEVVAR